MTAASDENLAQGRPAVASASPPLSELSLERKVTSDNNYNYKGNDLKEPVLEGEPAECVHHKLPGGEVPGGVDNGGVTRHRAHGAQHLGNKVSDVTCHT